MKMAPDPEERVPLDARDEREREPAENEDEVIVIDPDHPRCPQCGWHNTRLSHTRTLLDRMVKVFSVKPFRCRSCGNRFRARFRSKKV